MERDNLDEPSSMKRPGSRGADEELEEGQPKVPKVDGSDSDSDTESESKSLNDETEPKSSCSSSSSSGTKNSNDSDSNGREVTDYTNLSTAQLTDSKEDSECVDLLPMDTDTDSTSSNLVVDTESTVSGDSATYAGVPKLPKDDSDETQAGAVACAVAVSVPRLRSLRKFPVFIVDYHHNVLDFIYKCVAGRYLPLESNMLIHFDSHPDMVISDLIDATKAYEKEDVKARTSIENWIMPLCFVGIFTRIVWIKKSWCDQIPLGKHVFQIGDRNGQIFVDLQFPYFLSEANYCHSDHLTNKRTIELIVVDAGDLFAADDLTLLPESSLFFDDARLPYILDIDLDFFSVNNPFENMFPESNCYQHLKHIFDFDMHDIEQVGPTVVNQRRADQLKALKYIFQYLEVWNHLQDYHQPEDIPDLDEKTFVLVKMLAESLLAKYGSKSVDWTEVYDAGCTTDSGGLPIHISTPIELENMKVLFRSFLTKLPYDPVGVTIARSAEDNYCPIDQVDGIQEGVLESIDTTIGTRKEVKILYALEPTQYNLRDL